MSERLLVTGGAGFIGSNFVHQTLQKHPEYDVTVVDAVTYAANRKSLAEVEDQIEVIEGDIRDEELMQKLVKGHDIIVNFAGESHVDNSLKNSNPFLETNVLGVYSLLKAVRTHDKRLHHISTDEVFGDWPLGSTDKFTEDSPYRPSSPYSATKAGGEMLVQAWIRSYGVAATTSNCANNYGPRQHVEKFVPRQITNVLVGDRPKLYGAGASIREWTHVDDHNSAVHAILARGQLGERYIIGAGKDGEGHSVRDVLTFILELMDQPPDAFDLVADRPGHDMRYATDSSKIRRELGWEPRFDDLRAGLADTIKWYQENQGWWLPQKAITEARYKVA